MTDLAAWLTEIWDEQEEAAKACLGTGVLADMRRGIAPPRWVRDGSRIYDDRTTIGGGIVLSDPTVRVHHSWAREIEHIILNDPASVLARIAAERKTLADYLDACRSYTIERTPFREGQRFGLLLALARRAEAYADRPGYQEEWQP